MAFSFLQRGNLADHARQLTLASYEPALTLDDLVAGIDNVRHDVFLSPKFVDNARFHIFKLIAKHGNVEELASEEASVVRLRARMPARPVDRQLDTKRPFDPVEYKRLLTELHVVALTRAKVENNLSLDVVFRLAVLKFQRTELVNQYSAVLERCRSRLKLYEGPRQSGSTTTEGLRERVMRFQINKKAILRRAGQDLFVTLREAEKEALGKTRRSLFGEKDSAIFELFLNRLLFSDDGQDDVLNGEHYVMLGNYDRDPDRLQTIQEIIGELLKQLGVVAETDDPQIDHLLNVPENAQELMASGVPEDPGAKGKAQKAILHAWVELLEKQGVMESVLAAYEVVPLLQQYSPPINPQQLKTSLISRTERKRVETLLDEHGKISPAGLHAAVKKIETCKPAERARLAGRFFGDFLRYHRDLRRMETVLNIMDSVNVLGNEKFRELSAVNNTLYEFLLPEEQRPSEDKVVHHVILKADIRESTTLTRTLFERGLNPASYFSLNFYDPINKLMPKYAARKVFIEGDAIILALFERENEPALGVAQTCVLAKEIIEVVTAYNTSSTANGLPSLELGIGISYQDSAPMYLMDGTRQIMISKAINESDRLSGCHKGMRRLLEDRDLLFNVFSFKTVDDADTGGNPDEFLLRYNIGGIHISRAAFAKVRTEISLRAYDLEVPMIWRKSKVRVYTGMVPLGQGTFHRIIIREGRVAHVDPRDFALKALTEENYYEVCTNPRIYSVIESFQTAHAATVAVQ
jgi:class 3 adenylate cyclase